MCITISRPLTRGHTLSRGAAFGVCVWVYFYCTQNHVVALLHALAGIATLVPLLLFGEGTAIGGPNTPAQKAVISLSYGFFTYDLVSWVWSGLVAGW